ncbi:MAG: UDP-4-amino-4,6-dideoxy-N-acetyl-beta-L-altrosamine transaminase [Rhodobacteraceae bacterium]|nr:UDP-4-amino-4,6-dideoxy-N-acetyl-beta-L-altrosamine transaminase [Paracoccaceae bacterium]
MIPYGRHEITQADVDTVIDVLQNQFLTQGAQVPGFEKTVADYCGVAHGVAVNSATSALHIACLALGLGKGDWLWTSPLTFVASANCGLYCGAQVDFVDIDSKTYNMCPVKLEQKLVEAEKQGRLPKVVVPVHLRGEPCDMAAIAALAQRFGFKVIEDASHAIGGRYGTQKIGACQHSDITVFSFHPVKIVTTAEGGMAMTNDDDLAQRMGLFRSHGITRDPALMTKPSEGAWYYQQIELGYNYRLTDLQAALGISQMQRLDDIVAQRHLLADRYDKTLADMPLTLPQRGKTAYSGLHLYPVRLQLDQIDVSHREVFDRLRSSGIGVNLHYIPVHTQPYYQGMGFKVGDFPEAEKYYAEAITLPLFPTLTPKEQAEVVAALKTAITA